MGLKITQGTFIHQHSRGTKEVLPVGSIYSSKEKLSVSEEINYSSSSYITLIRHMLACGPYKKQKISGEGLRSQELCRI